MKRLTITLILLLTGAALCLCALLAISLFSGDTAFSGNRQDYALILEKEFDASTIRNVKITMSFEDICFLAGSGDTIQIREYANYTPRSGQLPTVEQRGSELQIKGKQIHFFSLLSLPSRDAYLEVYLPAGMFEALDSLWAETSSGDITSELALAPLERFTAATTSGDIRLKEISGSPDISSTSGYIILDSLSGNAQVSTTSGDIHVGQVAGDITASSTSGDLVLDFISGNAQVSTTSGYISLGEVKGGLNLSSTSGCIRLGTGHGGLLADTTSGDITVEWLEGEFQIDTSSGEVSILNGSGYGQAETISGDVSLFLETLSGDLSVSTTSGEVVLRLPETSSFLLEFNSTSGECSTFFDDALSFNKKGSQAKGQYGTGDHQVTVSTTSGDLWIQEK